MYYQNSTARYVSSKRGCRGRREHSVNAVLRVGEAKCILEISDYVKPLGCYIDTLISFALNVFVHVRLLVLVLNSLVVVILYK